MYYLDLLPYADNNKTTQDFMHTITESIFQYLAESNDRATKVVDFKTPEELQKIIDFNMNKKGVSLEIICDQVEKILQHSIRGGRIVYDFDMIMVLRN